MQKFTNSNEDPYADVPTMDYPEDREHQPEFEPDINHLFEAFESDVKQIDAVPSKTSWVPLDLNDILNREFEIPVPSLVPRTDGVCMLYPGKTHAFVGESESCKTWMALVAVKDALEAGHLVLWVDYEDDPVTAVSRLRALCVKDAVIRSGFHYVKPQQELQNKGGKFTPANSEFFELLQTNYALVVIDGVTESMETEGLDLMDNSDVSAWSRRIPLPLTLTGAAVVVLDHVVKSSDGGGRYAIGGQHKLSGLTGVQYVFSVFKPFYRATHSPVEGVVKISVTKDRPGHVRAHSKNGKEFGNLELTSYPDGGVTYRIVSLDEAKTSGPNSKLMDEILTYLTRYKGATKTAVERDVTGRGETIREAIAYMVDKGLLRVDPSGNGHKLYLVSEETE